MESKQIISALEALAQESRLAVFRALVQAGPAGMTPSALSEALDLPAPTLSFHLAQLRHAGLVAATRNGRSLTYVARYETMNGLVAYLTENCCAGACAPSRTQDRKEKTDEAPTRTRRRA
ncbi:MAG: metalloregulator ArsR/SmtB family transcription factor [Alphaproteobacteria bacterium]|nr:metalloregulator ArsR/SmtB family transcription factor [Alphaproteobacteria bacterium]